MMTAFSQLVEESARIWCFRMLSDFVPIPAVSPVPSMLDLFPVHFRKMVVFLSKAGMSTALWQVTI